jgi:NagD protein
LEKLYLIDIQGTLIDDKKREPIKGAVEFIDSLNAKKIPYVLITNNTKFASEEFKSYLRGLGFSFDDRAYIDPLMCLKSFVEHKSIYAVGNDNFKDALKEQGYVFSEKPDFLVISLKENLTYDDMASAVEMIQNGAKLIAMHATAIYAKNGRKYPGLGAIAKALEFATGVKAKTVGKPSSDFYKKALSMLGAKDKSEVTVISDDAIGDLIGAKKMGMKTVLVLSGKYDKKEQILPFLKDDELPDAVFDSVERIKIGA